MFVVLVGRLAADVKMVQNLRRSIVEIHYSFVILERKNWVIFNGN